MIVFWFVVIGLAGLTLLYAAIAGEWDRCERRRRGGGRRGR